MKHDPSAGAELYGLEGMPVSLLRPGDTEVLVWTPDPRPADGVMTWRAITEGRPLDRLAFDELRLSVAWLSSPAMSMMRSVRSRISIASHQSFFGCKRTAQVVLADLAFVETPAMVLSCS